MSSTSARVPVATPRPPDVLAAHPRSVFVAALLLCVATLAVYANSLGTPFVYDDLPSITENLSLRSLRTAFSPPPGGLTVSGRPLVNATFAVNYAISGTDVRSYHVTNGLIHLLAGLTLFGLVRHTLHLPSAGARFAPHALPIAFTIALLWLLHPLQTQAVTYVVQRAESLMSLCYLATLYAFVRSLETSRPALWRAASVLACLLGMASKENMVSAPLLVLLFDRAFAAGTFAAALRRRAPFYLALAATWLLLAWLVLGSGGNRAGTAGLGTSVTFGEYVLTQFPALVRYLRLALWPNDLVFDYGPFWIDRPWSILPHALVVLALVAAIAWALVRRPALGFLGAGFFALLAPSSLMPVVMQRIVEHRMYLPLASVVTLVVLAAFRLGARRALLGLVALSLPLGLATVSRNRDYASPLALWQDALAKHPNSTAHLGVASALAARGQHEDALAHTDAALRLQPNQTMALANRGQLLTELRRAPEALAPLEEALRLKPDYGQAHLNLGVALDVLNRPADALPHHAAAARLLPHSAQARHNYGDALCRAGHADEGLAHLHEALRLDPGFVDAQYSLASALARLHRIEEAREHFETASRLRPNSPAAHSLWAHALLAAGEIDTALTSFRRAIALAPTEAALHFDLGNALAAREDYEAALAAFTEAVRLAPDHAAARHNLGNTLLALHRDAEAIPHFEFSLRADPTDALTHQNLGLALARLGRLAEATSHFREAVRLNPSSGDAREFLQRAEAELRGK